MKIRLSLPIAMLTAALPLLIFAIVVAGLYIREQGRSRDATLRHYAERLQLAVDRQVGNEIEALKALAASPELDTLDLANFGEHARRTLDQRRDWLDLILVDRDRKLFDTRPPAAGTRPADADDLRTAFDLARPFVGNLVTSSDWPEPVIVIRVPVVRGGEVRQVLAAVVRAGVFADLLRDQLPRGNWQAAAFDVEHRLFAWAGAALPEPGLPLPAPPTSAWAGLGTDTIAPGFFSDPPGSPWYEGFAIPTQLANWTIVAAIPRGAAGPGPAPVILVMGGGVLAAILAGLLAFSVGHTIYRRRAAERALDVLATERAIETRLADISANLPGMIYRRIRHPNGSMEFPFISNGAGLAATLGVEFTDGPGLVRLLIASMTKASAEAWRTALAHTARTLTAFDLEYEVIIAGRSHWLRSYAHTRAEPGGGVVWDGVLLDVTAEKEAEAASRIGAERLHVALQAARLGLFDHDLTTDALTWSDRHRELLGVAPDVPVTAELFRSLVHPGDRKRTSAAFEAALDPAGGGDYDLRHRCIRPDGTVVWVATKGRAIFTGTGLTRRAVRLIGVVSDVTAAIEAERAMEEAKRAAVEARIAAERANRAKSSFLAAASHDLRQPVQGLVLLLPTLADHVASPLGRTILATARQAADAMRHLLDTLLDMSRLDAGLIVPHVEEFPLSRVLDELAIHRPVAVQKGLELRIADSKAVVRTDPGLLGRMLGNLIENAIKYTDDGRIAVDARLDGPLLQISVADTGPGIPPDHLGRIWDEFHQVGNPERDRSRGLGLGLAIVQRLSRLLDIPVSVESRFGEGSTFSVSVPVVSAVAYRPEERLSRQSQDGGGRQALLVEDDALVRAGLEIVLREWGYEVTPAASMEEAVAALRGTAGLRPDVMLADYRLRAGETGLEVIKAVRSEIGVTVPAIVLTGETSAEAMGEIRSSGHTVISKPVAPDVLQAALAGVVRQHA
ncbi:ATP-binding protein [Arenibaculum pallidiluteum]|uniref:ATP-binding protein n=1 Tax=Arenibaculum pallidiluteum TaxID=2812559 RepID=UPI001A964A28|nr:ATP-binding protein [Arenibaculum pallidiluteum]